jgi:dihydroorotate dehydrogenase
LFDYYAWVGPLIRRLEAEKAHRLTIRALRTGLLPGGAASDDPILATGLWGLRFSNPIGLAAGFDKNAEVPDAMLALGFGFVEVGTVTPEPQPGSPRPRLFRLPEDGAVINRMGFDSEGIAVVARRLARRGASPIGVVGGNVGPNKGVADPVAACAAAVDRLCSCVDYLVVNVSSPNTPGLRALQRGPHLARLLAAAREAAGSTTPLLVKVAPDLSGDERREIAEVVVEAGIDGLIATNTTITRPQNLHGRHRVETGGLSGAPLFEPSTRVLADFHRLTGGRLPLIGVGGIASGAQAYAKIRAGASLVQLYTALVYHGPALIGRIARELAELLRRDGFASVTDAVGIDARRRQSATAGTAP